MTARIMPARWAERCVSRAPRRGLALVQRQWHPVGDTGLDRGLERRRVLVDLRREVEDAIRGWVGHVRDAMTPYTGGELHDLRVLRGAHGLVARPLASGR